MMKMFTWLLDVLFPPLCLNCRHNIESGKVVCDSCFSAIKISDTLFCGKCRARLPAAVPAKAGLALPATGQTEHKKICHLDFPYLLGAAADYRDEAVQELVHALKFDFVKAAARPLAALLVKYAERVNYPIDGFVIVPIPLSKTRKRKRGFNQSFLLAEIFADRFDLEFHPSILVRHKNTLAQSELKDFEKKRANVENCFSVAEPDMVQGKNFILIDDVVTSGATLFEAANALKRAGAKKIIAFAAAKS